MKPKVSVIIPTYNDANDLPVAIDSVLAQTYDNIELIVVNYAPGDDAIDKIAESYGAKIKYYRNDSGSIAAALNFGAQKMGGRYFSWLLPGDVYHHDNIEKQAAAISGTTNTIAISGWTIVSGGGRKTHIRLQDHRLEEYPGCFLAFTRATHLHTRAMLIPKEAFGESELFDGSLPPFDDHKMLNRLVMAGAGFRITQQPLVDLGPYPQWQAPVGVTHNNYDFMYSSIINTLRYEDIIGYFGGKQSAILYYKEALTSGFPRTAAFLASQIIKGCAAVNGNDAAKRVLLDDVSGLSETQLATGADVLLSKIVQPSGKKKILFCSAHWLTGGMERVMAILFRELKDDYEIFLITPYDERKSHINVPDFVTSIKIADDLFVGYFDSLALTYALLLDIDVAVGFINLFEKQLSFYNLCAATKIKTIASNHEYYFYPYKSPAHYEVVEKRLSAYKNCDVVVWPNNFNAALCGMYVDHNYVIGNPNSFEISQDTKLPKERVIVSVGRFDDHVKRIDRILECFSLVLNKVPDAKLVLVGKYDNNAPILPNDRITVNNMIERLAIPSSSLRFVGEVNNVQDYYAEAKVLLLTSNSEGFGMVINEAACFGVPSVCNYIPGIEDIITDGENGYITEQDDISSMALRVSDILSDDILQARLSNNAQKKAVAYDSKHIGDKWRYAINSLIEAKDPNSLHTKLGNELGYEVDTQKLLQTVSRELNEIFYMSIRGGAQHRSAHVVVRILSKFRKLPAKLKANIEYEGWLKTGSKVVTRSYHMARKILKV